MDNKALVVFYCIECHHINTLDFKIDMNTIWIEKFDKNFYLGISCKEMSQSIF